MLPAYGVAVGTYRSFSTEQGQWYHVVLSFDCAGQSYQAAVDCNEVNDQFQYCILSSLDQTLFPLLSVSEGWHTLPSNSVSGAIDYARSAILQQRFGCLALWYTLFGPKTDLWKTVTGNEAGEALIGMVADATRIFIFGAPYTKGLGVHDVHCNQGDPPGPHRTADGVWQDGCVFALQPDGSLSAYLGKFSTQTLNTDSNGLPR